jgi:hypothetical protein
MFTVKQIPGNAKIQMSFRRPMEVERHSIRIKTFKSHKLLLGTHDMLSCQWILPTKRANQ